MEGSDINCLMGPRGRHLPNSPLPEKDGGWRLRASGRTSGVGIGKGCADEMGELMYCGRKLM